MVVHCAVNVVGNGVARVLASSGPEGLLPMTNRGAVLLFQKVIKKPFENGTIFERDF